MDYTGFKFRSQVDWIELEIKLEAASNFWAMQDRLGPLLGLAEGRKPSIESIDAGPGGAASIFRFRIHDSATWREVAAVLKRVEREIDLAELPRVTAIEVAFDAYAKSGTTRDELAVMAATFYKFASADLGNNHRLFHQRKGLVWGMPSTFRELARELRNGWNIAMGDKHADRYGHVYVKTTDDNGRPLPESEHRARTEVTLRGDALPCNTLEEWARFRFEDLLRPDAEGQRLFNYRRLKDDLAPLVRKPLEERGLQISPRRQRARKGGGSRLFAGSTQADSALNPKVRDAFRKLSARWNTGRDTAAIAAGSDTIACGNSGGSASKNPSKCCESSARPNNYHCNTVEPSPALSPSSSKTSQVAPDANLIELDNTRDTDPIESDNTRAHHTDTNIRHLKENGVSIGDERADENDDQRPVYGKQWRRWEASAADDDSAYYRRLLQEVEALADAIEAKETGVKKAFGGYGDPKGIAPVGYSVYPVLSSSTTRP